METKNPDKPSKDDVPKSKPSENGPPSVSITAADRISVLESIWMQLDALESLSRQLGVAKMEEELIDFVNLIRSRLTALEADASQLAIKSKKGRSQRNA